MAAVLLLVLLSSQIYLSDASRAAGLQLQARQHGSKLPHIPTGPWSSRRSLQQQIPVPPAQTVIDQPRGTPEPLPAVDQAPSSPPEPPKTASSNAADATVVPPSPAQPAPPSPDSSIAMNQRRTLQLPPHVYLISFVMLLAIMGGLLTCHCWRMCRIARRMRRAAELGVTVSAAGSMLSKRTPQSVIESLPVAKYSSIQSQRHPKSDSIAGSKATAGIGAGSAAADVDGSHRMSSFVAAAMQLREQFARQSALGSLSFGSTSNTTQAAAAAAAVAADAPAAGPPDTSQHLRRSSSTNSVPNWRRSFSFGRRNATTTEITAAPAADGDSCHHAAAAAAAVAVTIPTVGDLSTGSQLPNRGQSPDVITAPGHDQSASAIAPASAAPAVDGSKAQLPICNSSSSGAEPCAICFEDFSPNDDVKQLPCNHFFHVSCIDEWLIRDVTCPLCKGTVLDEALVQQQQQVAAALEASFGGLGGGSIARRRAQRQQQQRADSSRSRSSRHSRRSRRSRSAAAATDLEQQQQQQDVENQASSSRSSYREILELTSTAMSHALRVRSAGAGGSAAQPEQGQQQQAASSSETAGVAAAAVGSSRAGFASDRAGIAGNTAAAATVTAAAPAGDIESGSRD